MPKALVKNSVPVCQRRRMAHHTCWALIGCLNRKCASGPGVIKRQKVVDLAAAVMVVTAVGGWGGGVVDVLSVNGLGKNRKAVSSVSAPLPATRLVAANWRQSFISQAAGVFFRGFPLLFLLQEPC